MAKTKAKTRTVGDSAPKGLTIRSTNPAILSEQIFQLQKMIKSSDEAKEIAYDNTDSGLTAANVQAAIDEIVGDVGNIPVIKTETVTVTTGADGNISVNLYLSSVVLLSATKLRDTTDNSLAFVNIGLTGGGNQYLLGVRQSDGTALASTKINVKLAYIEI